MPYLHVRLDPKVSMPLFALLRATGFFYQQEKPPIVFEHTCIDSDSLSISFSFSLFFSLSLSLSNILPRSKFDWPSCSASHGRNMKRA